MPICDGDARCAYEDATARIDDVIIADSNTQPRLPEPNLDQVTDRRRSRVQHDPRVLRGAWWRSPASTSSRATSYRPSSRSGCRARPRPTRSRSTELPAARSTRRPTCTTSTSTDFRSSELPLSCWCRSWMGRSRFIPSPERAAAAGTRPKTSPSKRS